MHYALAPLAHQAIVITGASSGMGLATARLAAARGARVLLAARDGDALARIADELSREGHTVAFRVTDVASELDVEELADEAIRRFGGFDTWINVAGVGLVAPLDRTTESDHRRLFDVNYWSVVHGSMVAVRHFRDAHRPGAVINFGSAASDVPLPFSGAYAATKHAVKGFTTALRIELLHERLPVSVTLVKPSAVDSKFAEHAKTVFGAASILPPPLYTPALVARTVLDAAEHPRREITVGWPAAIGGLLMQLVPSVVERVLARVSRDAVVDPHRPPPLLESLDDVPHEGEERSGLAIRAHGSSWVASAQIHPALTGLLACAATVLAASALRWIASDRRARPSVTPGASRETRAPRPVAARFRELAWALRSPKHFV